jgi:hypothetical protein
MYLVEMGWEGMDRLHEAKVTYKWQSVMNTGMNMRVP